MKNFTASLRTSSKYGLSKLCTPELNTFRRARLFLKNHANGFLRVMLFVPFIFFLGGVKKSQAQQNPLSPVQGFNIFSYGNATLTNGDANGGLATFGNLTLNGAYSLSMSTTGSFKASGDANNTALIVEGNVSYSAGSGVNILNGGFVKIKDFTTSKYWSTNPTRISAAGASSQDVNPRINLSASQTQASINADVFDFNTAIANMRSYSTTYKGCSSNTTVSTTATSYTFNLTAGRTNFFKMTASQLALFNEIKFNIVPSATNPVVITVDIGTATAFNWTIPNFPGVPNAAGQYILFNFVNSSAGSTTIYLNGGSTIVGTVFAPNAHVNKAGSGNIEGQVVCMNYTHAQGEVHYQTFNTTVNCSSFSSVTCDCPGGLLKNPGFEVPEFRSGYNTSYKTAYWEWNSAGSLTTGSGFEVCDANNAYLYANSSSAMMWQKVDNITAGTSYTLSAYGGTHEPAYNHRYRLAFYNSAGTLLDYAEASVDWDVDVVPAGQTILKEYVLTKTAPTGTSYLRVEGYASGDWLKLDNLCLTVNNTCNNLTSGGTIGSNQVLCKNVSSTPAALTSVTAPSGGDTGQTIQYQWYKATSLENGACPTNVAGSSKYTAISGATAATYTPGAITQTTCYIRTARRTNCNDYVAESNAVLVVLKNNCATVACTNNIVTNSSFETDDNVTNNGKKFPVYFQSSPASYITRTATNTDAYRGASPADWAIGTDVNDYANQNGAYYIDASVTGNANSGDRFIYGRYNQCVLFAPSANQKFFPVTPGKKYKICAYMAAFNPSGVQGNADVYFEYKFRNAEGGDKGILSTGDIYQSIPADTDGQWETLNWQQYCVEIVAPAGATYLELYITPRDNEGDGVAFDDICMTEETCTSVPVVSSASICGTGTATLTATGCTGGTVKWYSGSTDTTPIATGATYTPASRSTSLNLFATCTLNNCESMKTPVNLTVSGAVSGVSATAVGGNTSNCGTPITINGAGSVANPNLVYNGDFSAGDIGFVTQYGEQNYGYGVYGVTTDANTYFSWASACKDRTASGTGKVFVADGGTTANLTVWGQRISVNPNTTYRLSTYATSISSTTPSTLAFYVNGVKVGTSTTLSATTCAWQQLTTTWNSGSSTTAYFEIRNENTNTGGNDFAIDDISMTVDAPVVTYSWAGPNSFSATTQNITASTTGTYTLTVTGNTGCSSNASIAITINSTPSSPTTTPATRCGAGTVTLGATCGSGETAQWYSSQSSTTVLTTGASYSPSLTASTTYYVGCKNTTTSCETPTANRTAVTGTINALPTAPSSSNVTNGAVCGSGVVNLSAVCSSGQTVQWYASQTSTSVLTTGTSYVPSITATTTYYVGCKDNTTTCETATNSRQAVVGTVNPIPSSPSAGNVSGGAVCGSGVVNLSATCSTGQTVQWYASQTSTVVLTTGTSYAPSIAATTTYYVGCKDNTTTCETATNSRQAVVGTVNPIPSAPSSGNVTNGAVCGSGVVNLSATCSTGQTVQWYASQSSTSVLTTGTSYAPSITATTTYYVACKDNTTNCETTTGTRQGVIGTVNPIPSAPSANNVVGASRCEAGVVTLTATCSTGQTVQWYASQSSTSVLTTGTSYSPSLTATTTYYVGCKDNTTTCETTSGTRQSVVGTVNPNLPAPSSSSVQGGAVCGSGVVNLSAVCSSGQTVQWYASQSSTSVLTTGTSYAPSITATTTYYVGCKDNTTTCETATNSRQAVVGTVNPIPSSPSAGNVSGGAVCGSGVVNLSATCSTGQTVQWYASQTSTTVLTTGTSYAPSIAATTTYYVGCKDNTTTCETAPNARQAVVGTVNSIPSAPSSGNVTNGAVCGSGVVNLTATCSTGQTVQWYASQTSTSVLTTGTSYAPSITATTTYYVGCKDNTTNCETTSGTRQSVIGTVNPIPSAPSSSNVVGASRCEAGVVTLTATCSTGQTVQWYASQSSTSVLTTGTSYSPSLTATTTYYVGCKDNTTTCETTSGTRQSVVGTVNPNLPAPSSSSVQGGAVCGSGVVNLSAVCSSGQTVQWYASQSSTSVLTTGTSYAPSITATTTYYVGCKDNTTTCETATNSRQAVVGTVNPIPSSPSAGNVSGGAVCGSGVVNLTATCSTGQTVQWYASQTSTVVLSTGTSYAPSIAATTTYYVGCKDNTTTCETATNSRQSVVGTVNPIPSAPSSSNVTNGAVCGSGVVNLTATCSTGQTVQWYASQTSTSVLTTGTSYAPSITATTTYYVACRDNTTNCETATGTRQGVIGTVNPIPSAPSANNVVGASRCEAGVVTLTATCSTGQTVQWYASQSSTSVLTTGTSYSPSLTATTTYYVGCKDNTTTCETASGTRQSVVGTVNPNLPAPSSSNVTNGAVCGSGVVNLGAVCSSGQTVQWYASQTSTSVLTTGTSYAPSITATTTYYVGCKDNTTTCETATNSRQAVVGTVNPIPSSPSAGNVTGGAVCGSGVVNLSATCSTGQTVQWYASQTSTTVLTTGTSYAPSITATTTYYVGCKDNTTTCETAPNARQAVVGTVNSIPSAPSSGNVTNGAVCGSGVVNLTATCSTGQTVQWYASQTSTSVLTTGTSYAPSITATTTYYVGCKDNTTNCETTSGTRQGVIGTVNPIPSAPSANNVVGASRCEAGVVTLTATCSTGQTVQWYASQSSTSVLTTGASYSPSLTASTTYYVGCKNTTTSCETPTANRTAVTGTINALPTAPSSSNVTNGAVCGSGVVNLSAVCSSGQTVQWYASQTSTSVLTTGTSYVPSITATTTYYVGCKDNTTTCETATNSRQAVVGTVNPIPSSPSAGNVSGGAVCGSGVVNLSATCSTGQTVQWYASQTSTVVLTTGTSYAPSIAATTTYYVGCKDNTTTCETATNSRQAVVGTVNPIPSAPSSGNVTNGAVCGSGVVNLSATCTTGQTVQWYASQSSTSVLTTGTSYAPSITATTTYYVACRDNTTNCETATGTRQGVIGTVNPIPSAPSSSNVVGASRCEAGVVTLTATCSTGQTVQWYASQSSTSVLTTGTSYSPSLTATTTYYVGCKDNTTTCTTTAGTRQSVVGTVNPNLPAPSSSNVTNGAVCGSGVVNLSAVCSSGQTVQWYASQTSTSVLTTGTSYSPSITATTTYYVGCKDNTTTCETATNSRQAVVGTVNPIPSSPSAGNVSGGAVCGSGVVSLSTTCSTGQTVQWYASQTSTTVLTTGTSYAPSIAATTTYYVGCKDNTTTCETAPNARQAVVGTVNPIPSAPSSGNVTNGAVCGSGVVNLTATCSTGQTVQWYASQTSTSVLTTGTSYAPSITATTTYYVACRDNTTNCETATGTRRGVIGIVNPIPSAPSSSNVVGASRCEAGVVTLTATCSTGQTVQWYASQSSTSVLTTGTSYSPSLTATTTYYVGCKDNTTTCETTSGTRQSVVGTVNPNLPAPSSSSVQGGAVCGSGVVNLSAVCSSGQTVQWYASQTSTSVLTTGTSYAPSITATTTYYVGCKDNTTTCETAANSRQAVVGTVNPIPSSPSAGNVSGGAVCGSGVVNLSATCSTGQTVQWYASQTSTTVLTTGTSYAPSIAATTTYYVGCKDNTTTCETAPNARQSVVGTVNPIPSAPSAGNVSGGAVCGSGVVNLTATCSSGQTVQWYASQSSTSVLTTGTSYAPSITATTTYYVGCKDNTTNCETTTGTRQSVIGTVNPIPSAPSSSNVVGASRCEAGVVTLTATCSTGQTVQWYASQTSTSVLTTGTSYAPSLTATTTYYVGCKDNTTTCTTIAGTRQSVVGTVNPNLPAPSSSSVQGGAVCGSGVVNLSAVCSSGQTVQWYASQSSTTVLTTGTSYAPSITATTTYYVGCKDNTTTCETAANSRQAVVGTVNPIPSSPSAGNVSGGAVCGSGVVNLSATCSTGQTVQWYASQTSTTVLSTGTSYAPSISATTTYYVGCKDNTTTCETATNSRQAVVGTVNPIPSAPSSSNVTNGAVCGSGVVNLSATCSSGQTVQWYASQSSTSVLTTGTSYAPSITATTTYYVACKDNTTNCETATGTRQGVIGTVNPIPSAPSSNNVVGASRCEAGVVTLTATCSTGQTVQWYASQSSTSVLTTGTSYSPSLTATTTYYVGCKDNTTTCETATGTRQSVVGTVNPNLPAPSSSSVQGGAVCGSGVVNLSAVCSSGQTVQWYASQSSTSVLTTGTSYAPSITATTTYYVGCKDNTTTCETATNSRQAVVGTVNPIPSSPSAGNVSGGAVCGSGVVNLTATCSTGQTVQWYASQTSTTVLTTGTSYAPSIAATTTYYVGCKDNTTTCETAPNARQSVVGTVNPIPSAPSAGNVSGGAVCGSGVVNLTATCSSGQTVQWYASQSSTSVLTTGTSYAPSITATTTYYVGCKDNTTNCETTTGTRQSVIGTVNPIPSAPSSSNVVGASRCEAGVVTLTATCSTGQTVQWYASQTSTSVLTTGTSYAPSLTATTTYYVGCKDNTTTCTTIAGTRQSVVGTVNPNLPAPSSSSVQGGAVCGSGVVNLSAVCSSGQTVQWYASQTSTSVLTTGTSYAPSITATTTYYVGCKDNTTTCETATNSRQAVVGTVNPIPPAPSPSNVTNNSRCGSGVLTLGATCGAGETVQWYASQTSTTVLSTGTSYSPSISATTSYYVACKNNTTLCEVAIGGRTPVVGTVNLIPDAPASADVQGGSVCGTGNLTLTANCRDASLTPVWYSSQSSTTMLTSGNAYTVAVSANATYFVSCKNTTTSCETPVGSRRSVDVIYNSKPTPVATTNSPVCIGGTVTLSTSGGTSYLWEGPNGYSSTSATPSLTNASTSLNGIYTVTVSGTGGCTGTATVEVVVRTKPTVTASVTDATVCNNSTIELKANGTAASGATIASYTWSGPSSFASTSQNPTISGAQEANEGFYNVKATDSFGCTATSEIFVFVNPVPTATASSEGGTIICQGAPISLYGNGGGIGGSYSWAGPAGYSSTIQNPTIPISSPTYAGVYTLTVTDANGCTAGTTISISLDKCLKLGDLVWDDLNNNGIKDAGESGISNVTVKLYRDANNDNVPDGAAIATQVTTSTGNYLFTGLEPDNYIVGIIAPAGYISSTGKNGSATGPYEGSATPDPDNDVNNDDNGTLVGTEIITKAITLVPYTEPVNDGDTDNTSNLTVDFGLFKPSKIGDLVWYDTNRDGIQNETPLNGVNNVTVTLTDGLGNILATTTTNSSGIYGFDYLGLGDYKVVFSTSTLPAGYVISTKDAGGDDTKDSDADLTGTTGVVSITVPGTSNLTVDAGVNCPAAQISVSTDKNTYCAGSTVKLTTVVTGTPTVSQYSWSGPASFTSTSQSPTINGVTTAQSGVYTLTVTANNACSATTTATVNVVVNALPTVSATLVNTVVCQGQTIELKANGSGSNYSWSGPSSFTSTQQNPTIASATTANSGTYTVVVSDGNICSASTTVQVTVNTLPVLTAIGGTICQGQSLNLSVTGASTYSWTGPNGFTATGASPSVNTQGVYTVTGTNAIGCIGTATASVTVNPLPTATAVSPTGSVLCQGLTLSLEASGAGVGGSYLWSGPNSFSSTSQNPTIPNTTGVNAGVYTVVVTNSNNCSATATVSVTIDKCLKLGDLVWDDLNNNGIKDAGESGISNVTVKLYRDTNNDNVPDGVAIATQVTTSTGNYLFTGLEPDNYIVGIIAPAGYISSTGKNGSATGPYEGSATPDPDNDVNNDDNGTLVGAEIQTKSITLYPSTEPTNDGDTDNNSNLTVDFGLFKPSKIGDLVWYDTNRDGIQNETPLNGVNNVTVTLTDGLGNILATTTTNSSGIYGFDYLGLGDYKVVFSTSTLPAGYVISTNDAGGDDTKDSDADLTGTTGVVSITVPGTSNLTVDAGVNCPAAQISVSTDKNTYCAGSTVKLTTVVTGTPTVSQYSWSGPASFTSTSQSPTINGVTTAQSGVYTLTVTANNACSATTTATVNVVVNALPTVSATLVNTVVCQGQTIELKANGSGSNYSWSGPSSFTSTQQNPTIASATTANSGTYTVVVSDGNICSASTTVQVTVNTLPVLTATGGTICQGQSLNLGVTGASTYSWTGPNGFTATGASPSVNTQGVYTVTGTNAIGCIGTATASVTVNPAATISVSNVEVCVGGVAQLTATGASTYSWTGPNGFTSTSAQALISNSAAITMNGVYTVVGTTSLGCVGSATASLTVKENPVVTISGNRVICPGGQVALTANSSGTFAWTGPNGFTANTATINVSTAGSYQVVVTNNGCSATGTVTLTTETFNVNASASATTVCSGGSVNLNVNATVGSGVKSYSWSGPAGFTATTTNPVLSNVSVSNSGTYTVTVEGNSGCTTTATVSITVSPIPTTNKAIEFCEGSTTTLAVTGFTNATYSWNTSATTSSISVSTAGAYTVNTTEANGCKSVQVFNVTQNPKAATVVTGATAFCSDASTQLTINSGVTSGQTYLWTGPNGFSSTSQTVSITQEGTYTVKVITDKNCEATTTVAVTKNTVNATATSVSACAGSSITLGASGGTSYSWEGPNGFTSTAQNPVVSGASALSQGIYMVTVSANGCVATATTDVMVYAKPNFVPIVTNSECNKTTTLNNGSIRIAGFNTGDKYDIVEASTYTGTKNFATATVIPTNGILMANIPNPTATKTYTIRVFNANGCFTDQVVRIQPVACDCGPQECVPITIQKSAR